MGIAAEIARIAERHHLGLVLRFGSSVTGRTHAGSDVDIGVLFDGDLPSFDELAEFTTELQRLFPGCEIDLAILDTADPLFLYKVTENCELLYGEPRRLTELKIYAYKRYHDHKRFLAMERAYVRRVLSELTPR